VRYRYYISCVLAQGRKSEAGSIARVAASEIEGRVRNAFKSIPKTGGIVDDREESHEPSDMFRDKVERVTVSANQITIELSGQDEAAGPIRITWTPPRHARHRQIIRNDPGKTAEAVSGTRRTLKSDVRARIVVAIVKARVWLDQLVRSEVPDIEAIAQRERRSERSVRMTLSLAFLAPDIVEAVIKGTLAPGLRLTDLTDLPMSWTEQSQKLGLYRSET